jgi:RNA polymerase sigma factor (sigma-70 family)
MKQTETEKEQRKQLFVEFQQSKVFNTDTKTLSCFSIEQRNNLVETNLKLVDYVLDRYFKPHKYNFDAKQEGRIGLLEAVERFEPAKGYQFSTYATPWIYSYIRAYLNGDSLKPKTPSHIEANISKLKKESKEKNCSVEDLLEETSNITSKMKSSITQALKNKRSNGVLSLDMEIGNTGITFGDSLVSPETDGVDTKLSTSDKQRVVQAVRKALLALPERQRLVVLLRYQIISKDEIPTKGNK